MELLSPGGGITDDRLMSEDNTIDRELLGRVAVGDEEALTELYRRKQAGIYRFALQMSGSAAVAEDVVQEVFLALMRNPGHYQPDRGPVGSFLYGIARNHLRRRLEADRAYQPEDETERIAANTDLHDVLRRQETIESVRAAVLSLPVHYREAVVLCDLHELDYAQAAEVLGCAVGTVRSRLHRARGLLAEKLRQARGPAPLPGEIKPVRCLT